jgi:hypothetical protein
MTQEQKQEVLELEEDIFDCEMQVKSAKEELEGAKRWLDKQTMYWAEAIIKLNNYKKNENII